MQVGKVGFALGDKLLGFLQLREAAGGLLDVGGEEVAGGCWTASTALGDRRGGRLEAHAGMRFDVLD